jgi:hypothetical protein
MLKKELVEENTRLRQILAEQRTLNEHLRAQLKIYERMAMYQEEGNRAISTTCDAVAHVLTALSRRRLP